MSWTLNWNDNKVGTYVVVDMFGLPADTIKDEFRTKESDNDDDAGNAGGNFGVDDFSDTGGPCEWFEPQL